MDTMRFRFARWVMNHRTKVGFIFLVITLAFAAGLPGLDIRTIFSDLLPADDPFVQTYKDHPNFGSPLAVTVMVKRTDGNTIYNTETLQKVWDLTRDIDLVPGVDHDRIISITTEKARYAESTPYGIDMRPLMGDSVPSDPEELAGFHTRVERSPAARTYLVSQDGTATLIRAAFHEQMLDYGVVFQRVRELVESASDGTHEVHMIGQPILTGNVYELQQQTYTIFGVTLLLLVVALVMYMRNMAGTITPIIVSAVAAIWGFGLVGWIHSPIEPLLMIVPLLLVARSFSHCVQYTERYYEILSHVGDKKKSAEITMAVMMPPSILGVVTDALGIIFIGLAPIPAMERFALFCGFWAMCLIPTGTILISLLLSYLPTPGNIDSIVGKDGDKGIHLLQKNILTGVGHLIHGSPRRITMTVMAVLSIVAIYIASQIHIGNPVEGSNLLWEDSDYNVATRKVNDHFPGVNSLEIIFDAHDTESTTRRTARTWDAYRISREIQRMVEGDETMPARKTRSFSDFMEEGNRLYAGGHPKWLPLDPSDQAVNAAGAAVSFGQNPLNFSDVVDFTFQNSTVSLFYRDNKQDTVDGALAAARKAVENVGIEHDDFSIRLASGTIALQEASNLVVERYHYLILLMLAAAILVITTYAYRSVVAAVILLIPVTLSNFYLTATMHALGIGLDINSVMVAVLGVGVGIDYGIYLLSRIVEEYSEQGQSWHKAITVALTTTGKAIMFTAMIMLVAILPWYFLSDLKFMADMGLLLAAIMLINMVLALLVLPIVVWVIKPKFVERNDLMVGENVDLSLFVDRGEPGLKGA